MEAEVEPKVVPAGFEAPTLEESMGGGADRLPAEEGLLALRVLVELTLRTSGEFAEIEAEGMALEAPGWP